MKVLVIGNGGREHAICWKLRQSPTVTELYCAPGNPGTAALAENVAIAASDVDALLSWALRHKADLTVVGPEAPLALGIVDRFRERGLAVFGPTRDAARLETSKAFAKEFMKRHRIPTAGFGVFTEREADAAHEFLRGARYPVVVKADGLAAGKGVVIAESFGEAADAASGMLRGSSFGEAGRTVVIEEFLEGLEASVFALTDGTRFLTLPPAQDHKRILDNDMGKNTGGMGAYAPTPYVSTEQLAEVKIRIIKPVLDGMRAEGLPYTGVLYTGLMLTDEGPKVLEFNCRFGDPETQVVLPLVDDDLAAIMLQIARGHLDARHIGLRDGNAVCVVMASNGYPDAYETGKPIAGLDSIGDAEVDVLVFHAGTKRSGKQLVTAGGRVLGVTAVGEGTDFGATIAHAYNAVHRICFDGAYYRTDIARRALEK